MSISRQSILEALSTVIEPDLKKRLESEGVEIQNDEVVKFKELYWNPEMNLKI